MSRVRAIYVCGECGTQQPKWTGQCPDCGAWNSLTEAAAPSAKGLRGVPESQARIVNADEVKVSADIRSSTGIGELDRVLGGGFVSGSAVLFGGDPGIGKSTLLLQALAKAAANGQSVLYVSAEESLAQVSLRARRLELPLEGLRLLAETRLDAILALVGETPPRLMVVDSIQTVYTDTLSSAPGSVAQVRESAARLVRFAKATGCTLALVGHVTKEGALAGPRVLEHLVDAVIYFESEANSRYRLIRSVKNRFGAANELGIFVMDERGLREVANPSSIFLSGEPICGAGSVVLVTREGTRPLLVELQALVDDTQMSNPRRLTVGLDQNRLSMLLAVLHRHGGLSTLGQDVFANVVGGVRVTETAADLPLLLAVVSSLRDRALPQATVCFGEVGLGAEIRPVPHGEERLQAAAKHGFKRAIVPKANKARQTVVGLELIAVDSLADALELLDH